MDNTGPGETAAPPGDFTIPQNWSHYTAEDHATWDRLYARQTRLLPGRVVPQFLDGLKLLGLEGPGIPDFDRLSDILMKRTGWQVVAVEGLIPDGAFFDHLANRRFVAGNFIRRPDQLDYLEEPDVFHDVFGHVPLLAHPVFADYMQAYGKGGQRASHLGAIQRLSRLYWYTVEFGLIRNGDDLAIYGAGIVSSAGESIYALEDPSPNRLGFNLERVMRTPYRIDDYQQTYFVIPSFEDLLHQTLDQDFAPIYAAMGRSQDFAITDIAPDDLIYTQGTQAYACARAAKHK